MVMEIKFHGRTSIIWVHSCNIAKFGGKVELVLFLFQMEKWAGNINNCIRYIQIPDVVTDISGYMWNICEAPRIVLFEMKKASVLAIFELSTGPDTKKTSLSCLQTSYPVGHYSYFISKNATSRVHIETKNCPVWNSNPC